MSRAAIILVFLTCVVAATRPAIGQTLRTTVILEVLLPEDAQLFIEGEEIAETGSQRTIESPPLPPGEYTYTIMAIIPGTDGPQSITRRIDVRPGDFESVDFRPRREGERVPDVLYEPTPQKVVEALLDLAQLKSDDVLRDLGCGDGRIPITAARKFGIQSHGFEIDPNCLEESRANVAKSDVAHLVTIEDRDIFTLDLSRGPTVVTLYLLPSLNLRLLPQLQQLPAGARVLSVGHRLGDIPPDEQIWVDDEEYFVYLWRVETLKNAATTFTEHPTGSPTVPLKDNSSSHNSAQSEDLPTQPNRLTIAFPVLAGAATFMLAILYFGARVHRRH